MDLRSLKVREPYCNAKASGGEQEGHMNSRWRRTTLRGAEVKGWNWHWSSYGPNSHVEFGGGKCSHSHRHDVCGLVCCTCNSIILRTLSQTWWTLMAMCGRMSACRSEKRRKRDDNFAARFDPSSDECRRRTCLELIA